ncbi:long-chain fatty acid--CoA ligase [Pseudomonas sp. P8_241]|uniref:acyl-CoA synthetase n=1 Tax=Pseudomonas sp. P8_241 TaxID=3043445 RepID=UPI002A36EA2C|nr:long-chain fatty acid--CoA ligase [Pseudomonas sp. P8_241]WPN49055.1 long-chain fatty acid--CoA ligase [Pseudomonas sp. P8_241]
MYITQGLHRHIQQKPNAIAVRDRGQALTFVQLGERVARLAAALQRLGVKPGDRVAMLAQNSVRYIEYFLAVPWANAVLNPVNSRWSLSEILYSLDDSETSVLIVDDAFMEQGKQIAVQAMTVEHVIHVGIDETPPLMLDYETLIAENPPVEDARRRGNALLGIFYTGGTTGFPKGVMLSHNNVASSSMATVAMGSYGADAVFLHVMPMFHLADIWAMTGLFISGGSHVVLPAFDPAMVLRTISEERVNQLLLAPTMIQMLLDWRDNHPQSAALDLGSLTTLYYGASTITPALLDRACKAFPRAQFFQGYGMTELSPMASTLSGEFHSVEHQASGKMYSAGQASVCTEVRIVDENDSEVPRGCVGEVIVRGPNVMLGYWKKPQATEAALKNGWMHTGDGGYMDADGFIHICDRLKDMIISGGENIYSAEVETAIASHQAVAQCAVIGIPSEKWGEAVHAVIVLKPDADTGFDDILVHCRERIAGYKCPRSVEFRSELPLSGVGKVLKTELRKPFWGTQP